MHQNMKLKRMRKRQERDGEKRIAKEREKVLNFSLSKLAIILIYFMHMYLFCVLKNFLNVINIKQHTFINICFLKYVNA